MKTIKLATFNINGVRSRLPSLLKWLDREQPDIVCLQELKAPDDAFPFAALRATGYGAVWHGQRAWNGVAILARGMDPIESRRGLPGGRGDDQSRYIEAAAHGIVVGCLYLPNGNPQPGPKFDYKLAWFERFIHYAATLYRSGHPVVLAGDYNVVPTDFDIYNPRSWLKDALLQPESRACYQRLLELGLFPPALANQLRPAHRSPAAEQRTRPAPARCRRRSLDARRARPQRPCTDVDHPGHNGIPQEDSGKKGSGNVRTGQSASQANEGHIKEEAMIPRFDDHAANLAAMFLRSTWHGRSLL
jgi:exodeoxyribonuclease III